MLTAFAVSTPAAISTPAPTDPAALVLTPLPTLMPVAVGGPEATAATDTRDSAAVIAMRDVATRDPASWTKYEISADVIAQLQEFVIAASAQPAPDYQRALATFAHACRQDEDAFTKYVNELRALAPGSRMGLLTWEVDRVGDQQAVVEAQIVLGNLRPVKNLQRYTFSYENGRWLNANC